MPARWKGGLVVGILVGQAQRHVLASSLVFLFQIIGGTPLNKIAIFIYLQGLSIKSHKKSLRRFLLGFATYFLVVGTSTQIRPVEGWIINHVELKVSYTINKHSHSNLKMDISDYDNTYKYKFILPILYVFNWALMLTGPFFYPAAYEVYCFAGVLFMAFKGIQSIVWNTVAITRGLKFLNKAKKIAEGKKNAITAQAELDEDACLRNNQNLEIAAPVKKEMFAFVIPSYKEDIELLGETLMHLASHTDARKRYLVFMAMQAHEEGSVEKAQLLISKYGKYFRLMSYSHHHIRENEQKGKASNVSWCVENLEEQEFKKHGINPDDVYLTVMDADSWAPEVYIAEVQERIEKEYELRHTTIFEPAQMFFRNHLDVPLTTRVYDMSHSGIHFTNLVSSFEISFPLSNYTLSFNLIKRIGFWDTCPDAIGEDFHTTIKAFWKTNGQVRTVELHIPFNQVNVQTGNGYMEDVMARFWQAERHARGCADVAYSMKMLTTQPFNWRTAFVSYHVFECFVLPTFLPWIVVGNLISNIIPYFMTPHERFIDASYFDFFFNIGGNSLLIAYSSCFLFYRYASKVLFNVNPGSILRIVEFPLMFLFTVVTMTVPTFVIAAFKVMLNKNEYNTAEKKVKSSNSSFIQNVEEQAVQKL